MKKTLVLIGVVIAMMMFLTACDNDTDDTDYNGTEYNAAENAAEEVANANIVEVGDRVAVEYTGSLEDGTVFDSSEGRAPLEFTAGAGQMIPGFDAAVLGMELGESKTATLAPEEAYGAAGVPDPANPDGYLIPPNSTLIFEIEVVAIQKAGS